MASISTAIGMDRIATISGYRISKGKFNETSPNLPMNIAILGEANTDKQGGLITDKIELTSSQEAGDLFGFGSPIHQIMRILRPVGSDGVGGIPTFVFPLATDLSSTQSTEEFTVTGTVSKNSKHTIYINGRSGYDYQTFDVLLESGDTASQVAAKYVEVINNVLSSPVTASDDTGGVFTISSKSKGISSNFNARISVNGNSSGLSYATTTSSAGAGVPDISDALSKFGNDWHTIVINPYESKLSDLETFNGTPDDADGRYVPYEFKPFVSLFGSTESTKEDISSITDSSDRINQVTNMLCPAPNSESSNLEAAANMAYLFSITMQNTPQLDVTNQGYPDISVPDNGNIGDMSSYPNRDYLVKKGASTVLFEKGEYEVQDFVTTYHPSGESPLQYSYGRNLIIDWNIKYGYDVLAKINVRNRALVKDDQETNVDKSVSPKQWKAILFDYFDNLAERGFIIDPEFSKSSLSVQISPTNPNRFETFFRYKRTGLARIESTSVEAGF